MGLPKLVTSTEERDLWVKEHALINLISTYIQIYDFAKLPPAFMAKYPEKLKQLCTLFSPITLPMMP